MLMTFTRFRLNRAESSGGDWSVLGGALGGALVGALVGAPALVDIASVWSEPRTGETRARGGRSPRSGHTLRRAMY